MTARPTRWRSDLVKSKRENKETKHQSPLKGRETNELNLLTRRSKEQRRGASMYKCVCVCVCDRKRSQPLGALVWGIIPRTEHCKNLVKTQHQSLKQTPEDLFTGARTWEPRNSSLRPAGGTQPSKPLALPGSYPVCGRVASLLTRPSPREEGAGHPSLQPQSL